MQLDLERTIHPPLVRHLDPTVAALLLQVFAVAYVMLRFVIWLYVCARRMVSAVKLCISSFRHTDQSTELQLLKRWSTMPFHSQSTKVCINIFILIDHNNNKLY